MARNPYEDLGQTRAHPARMYDVYLGGKTNYLADRKAAAQVMTVFPSVQVTALENRRFMHRAARYAAERLGLRQFLDIGTGVPTEPNLHQVVHAYQPDARVVYADNDPIVLTYARALLTSDSEGSTDYVDADVREPDKILEQAARTLDFTQPACLSLVALLHFVPEDQDPYGIVGRLVDALAPGSALVLSHATCDFDGQTEGVPPFAAVRDVYDAQGIRNRVVTREEMSRFFAGLELTEAGITTTVEWMPELETDGNRRLPGMISDAEVALYAGVGIKP